MIAFLLCPSVPLVRFDHPVMLLCYADKCIVNIIKVYIEKKKLQSLELIRYHKMFLTLFTFTFGKRRSIAH